jgi:primase-polymerase (primpol)-like protein
LPDELKASRQFLAWNLEAGGKKVPFKEDGSSWGNYQDANCWRTFENAIDLLDRRRAFGIGLVLCGPQKFRPT